MSNFDYINITKTTNNRYICESRDGNGRRIAVVAGSGDSIEAILLKLESELEPSEVELNRLKEEKAWMQEREIELTKNVAELNAANKNAAKVLAATYDDESISKYIKWKDALAKGFLNPGELVFYKGKMYTVISPTGTNDLMVPDKEPSIYLDISDAVKKPDLEKDDPKNEEKPK